MPNPYERFAIYSDMLDPEDNRIAEVQVFDLIQKSLRGELQPKTDEALEQKRQACLDGDPLLLAAHQWPGLIVRNDYEVEFFDIQKDLEKIEHLPDYLLNPLLNTEAPSLRLDWWQKLILVGLFSKPIAEICIKGCTGAGKGAVVSQGVNLWFDANEEARINLTSRSWDHALVNIFGEVKMWYKRMRTKRITARLLGHSIYETERHYVKILNPSPSGGTAGEAFSGAHGAGTMYVFDEATAAPDFFYTNAEKNAKKIISLANPRTLYGRFRDMFRPLGAMENEVGICPGEIGMRLCITVDGEYCSNVKHRRLKNPVGPKGGIPVGEKVYQEGEPIPEHDYVAIKPLISHQIDLSQFRAICAKQDQREVDVFAHGRFPVEDPEKQVIMESWYKRHLDAWNQENPPDVEGFGFDIARSLDGDSTVLTPGGKQGVRAIHVWKYANTVHHTNQSIAIARDHYGIDITEGNHPVVVDMDGLGAGVGDQLLEKGVWVVEYRGNASATIDPRKYTNNRTETYATLGRRLNPDDAWGDEPWALPYDLEMLADLAAPEKIYQGNDAMRFGVSPKRRPPGGSETGALSVEEKLGRSPDKGDSVAYLWYGVMLLHSYDTILRRREAPLIASYPGEERDREIAEVMKKVGTRDGVDKRTADLLDYLSEYSKGQGTSLATSWENLQ